MSFEGGKVLFFDKLLLLSLFILFWFSYTVAPQVERLTATLNRYIERQADYDLLQTR